MIGQLTFIVLYDIMKKKISQLITPTNKNFFETFYSKSYIKTFLVTNVAVN